MLEFTFSGSELVKAIARLSSAELDKDKQYTLTLKEYHAKRSLNANRYFWSLADKLAERIHESPIEIYRGYIKDIGGVSNDLVMKPEAVKEFKEYWGQLGKGWTVDILDGDEGGVLVRAYKGSSVYNTAQMSRLIDLIVQDCKQFGIETLDDMKIQQLVDEWEGI